MQREADNPKHIAFVIPRSRNSKAKFLGTKSEKKKNIPKNIWQSIKELSLQTDNDEKVASSKKHTLLKNHAQLETKMTKSYILFLTKTF